jgi:histidinol-phosphate aminotransferase
MRKRSKLARKALLRLKPWEEKAKKGIRLDQNLNPLINPAARRAMEHLGLQQLNQYPTYEELENALAIRYGVSAQEVILGDGSDELLGLAFKAFIDPGDRVAIPTPTYELYEFLGKANLATLVKVPLSNNFDLNSSAFEVVNPKLVIISRPNNPTGNLFSRADVIEVLEHVPLVLIDEAYIEFSKDKGFVTQIKEWDNLLVIRTFSKAYGLAGIRVGYALGQEPLIKELKRIKLPFNVSQPSKQIALEALRDKEFLGRVRKFVNGEKKRLKTKLKGIGLEVYPSETNFLLVKLPMNGRTFSKKLSKNEIWIKDCSHWIELKNFVRISVGEPEENDLLVNYMKEILMEER